MRIRSVKPEFWRDEVTGVMGAEVALFYLGLCSYCDDIGRFEWNPVLIRADIDPYDAKFGGVRGIERLLSALERLDRIKRYAVEGKHYGVMPSFGKHQKPKYPTPSRIPEPSAFLPQSSPNPPEVLSETVHGVGEGVGEGEGEQHCDALRAPPPSQPAAPPATQIPANGEAETRRPGRASASPKPKDGRHAAFVAAAHRIYGERFPGGRLTVNGKDGKHLADFLACQPTVTLAEFERVYAAALSLGGKWPGCTRVSDVVDRWTDLFAIAAQGNRTTGEAFRARANAGIKPVEAQWWDRLTPAQKRALDDEKTAIAPELIGAPLGSAGEVGQERPEVVALIGKWRAIAEGRTAA